MAASSVNNVAAAFGSSSTPSPTPSLSSSPSVLPPVSWNPQSAISPALKTSFVGLYGDAGPKRFSLPPRRFPSAAFRARSAPRTSSLAVAASIAVGEKLPDASLSYFDKEGNLQTVEVAALTKGKKIVLFAVPGAFTPTCTQKHLPGFVEKSDEMKAKGVDTIACVSVNDAFVMRAWGESLGVGEKVLLLSDGNGHFTKALGVTLDLSDKPVGLGVRSKRYSLLAEDGVVKVLNLEDGGSFSISGAEDILKVLS